MAENVRDGVDVGDPVAADLLGHAEVDALRSAVELSVRNTVFGRCAPPRAAFN